jgi:P pilus assembly chaperone PapD
MHKRFVIAALALVLGACSETTLPTGEWVQASATGDASLSVTNRGDAPVYIQVADPTELILLTGCTPSTCTRIAPGGTVQVPFSQIAAWQPGDQQAAVNWWVFEDDGGTVATGTVVVPL